MVAEYALQDINKPIGISEYRVSDKLGPALMVVYFYRTAQAALFLCLEHSASQDHS